MDIVWLPAAAVFFAACGLALGWIDRLREEV